MDQMPTAEVLEKAHTFPGAFMFKAIGKADDDFVARVVAAVREELAGDVDPPYTLRETSGGKHVAVTLEPYVQTPAQVLAVYRRIQGVAGLVMLL